MTSVKAQGGCGSCWAFAALGVMEAVINIDRSNPNIDMDLSEQHLVSVCCPYCGDCGGGSPSQALIYIMDNGVPDEDCFLYQASNTSCTPCSDWHDRAWTIGSYGWVDPSTTDAYKWGLETYGPMIVVLHAPTDFLYYKGGIYEPVLSEGWGAEPNHAVVLVGYNDTEQYWIIKNSWGTTWGKKGYGKVEYGVLEQYDYALVVDNTAGPTSPPAPVISSSTHPDESVWYCNRNPAFTWTTPSDPSGIDCYSYTMDHSSTTTPDEICDTTGNSKSYTDLAYDIWYFHVRAKNNVGNWGPADHYKVQIENCNDNDDWYCNGDIREYRDYYCSGGSCAYTVTSSENCNDYDGWVDTGDTQWIDDPGNECKEKEQKKQEYQDYFCAGGSCTYSVTDTQWIDTGEVRNKSDGTVCGCTANNTLKKCSDGTCSDTGTCNSTYCNADPACDGKKPGEVCGSDSKCNSTCKCISNRPPIASFTYSPGKPFVNQTIAFDASSSYDPDPEGYIVEYEWDFGDGTNATGVVVTHNYSINGTYTMKLTVTDNEGAKNLTTKIIEVRKAKPTVSIFTNKNEYHPYDIMITTIHLENPTESTQQVIFAWYLFLPDYGYWQKIVLTEITLPPEFDDYFLMPLIIKNWPSTEFNATWYVALYNTTSFKLISQDTADWRYTPHIMAKAERVVGAEEIAKEIKLSFGTGEYCQQNFLAS